MKKPSLLIVLFLVFGISLSAQTPLDKGNAAYGARNFKAAAFHFGRAIMDNPGNADLQMKLANCYRYLNKMNEAEKRYQLVCQNPNTAPINFFHYGSVLQANKKYDLAIQWFGKYAKENKNRAEKAQAACVFAKQQATLPSAFLVTKESGVSHLSYDDYAPFLHKGSLFFTSARKIKIGGGTSSEVNNYLYQASRGTSGQLSGLKIVKNPIEIAPQNNLTPLAINATETVAITTYNQFENGVRHLYKTTFINTGMEIATPKNNMKALTYIPAGDPFPHVGDDHSASFPHITNGGRTIYFAAYNLPGGYGGFDIWVIHQQGNQWTRPQNLGPNVNTSGDEISPSLTNNGYLFFSSDYHKGFGGFDVFRAKKEAGVWKQVRNLGNKVNSSFDDLYFVFDPITRTGYFSSNRDGFYNIYNAMKKGTDALMPLVNAKEQAIAVNDPTKNNGNNTNTNTNTIGGTNTNNKTNKINGNNTASNNNSTISGQAGTLTKTNNGGYKPVTNKTTDPPIDGYNSTAGTNKTVVNNNNPTIGTKPTVSPNGNGNTIPCAMNFYIGAVIDQETKRPLKGATVYIKNRKTGIENKIKDPTNHYGEYSVILDPLHDYTIAVSKSGFKNLVFDVNTGNGGKKTLLGTRAMTASPMVIRDKYGNIIDGDAPLVTTDSKPTDNELANPIKSTGKTFSYESNGTRMPKTGYLIQALVATSLTEEERLELSQYGNIITEDRGNKKAFRVGIFVDKEHLEKALTSIKTTYRDAFKVPVELDNNHLGGRIALSSQVIYPLPKQKPLPVLDDPIREEINRETPPPVVDQPIIKEKELNTWTNDALPEGMAARGVTTPDKPTVVFKVQLGAFKDADNLSFSEVGHLGMIEKQKRSNGLTYVYISSFKTLDEARVARTKAKEKGAASPFIVAFKNGNRVNISDVVN